MEGSQVVTLISVISMVITVVSAIFTVISLFGAINQRRKLQEISSSLSTRYIATFPDYIQEIVRVVDSASKNLNVMCTYPQHGAYSKPADWDKLDAAIKNVLCNERVTVRLLFSTAEQRLIADTKQFADAYVNWQPWRQRNSDKLCAYVAKHGRASDRTNISKEKVKAGIGLTDVVEWLWFQDEGEKETVLDWKDKREDAQILQSPHMMPVFAWIVDDEREAVFAMMTYDDDVIGHAFTTTDKRFIGALTKLIERYAKDSEPFDTKAADRQTVGDVLKHYS